MHSRLMRSGLLLLVALGSLALAGASLGQPERPKGGQPPRRSPQSGGGGPARAEVGQSVDQCMKAINGAAKILKDQVGDASKKDDNLKLIWTMQKNAVQAKTLEPEIFPAPEKAKLLAQYRKSQNELMRLLLKLEDEVAEGKSAAATKTFGAIGDLRDREHTRFKVKD